MTGGVVSCTITLKLPLTALPLESDAEHATEVVAIANVLPEGGIHVTVNEPSTISFAVAVKLTTAPAALVASTVMSAGSNRVGAVVSCTVMVKLPALELPAWSVEVQETVVIPSGKVEPELCEHPKIGAGSRLSLADAE